jgi:transcription initiation factor IIE alpha subunit
MATKMEYFACPQCETKMSLLFQVHAMVKYEYGILLEEYVFGLL